MIIEWFLDLVEGLVTWFLSLFEGLDIPTWALAPPPEIYQFFGNMNSMGVWVPWSVLSIVLTAVLGVYAVTFIIKMVKQILSHVPQFGGAG